MAMKITISIPDELHEEVKAWAEMTGNSVSGWFAELAQQRLDADRASRERLRRLNDPARKTDPDAYQRRQADFIARARASQEAAARRAAELRGGSPT
jgi:type I site-specific restriction endonuclease